MKQITSPGSLHETGCSGLGHWYDPEGWDGEGAGRGIPDGKLMWLTHVNVWQNQYSIVKQNKVKIKIKKKVSNEKKSYRSMDKNLGMQLLCLFC